jgi:hypothetical protein
MDLAQVLKITWARVFDALVRWASVPVNFNLDWECSSLAELAMVVFLLAGTTVLDTETPLGMPCSCR